MAATKCRKAYITNIYDVLLACVVDHNQYSCRVQGKGKQYLCTDQQLNDLVCVTAVKRTYYRVGNRP